MATTHKRLRFIVLGIFLLLTASVVVGYRFWVDADREGEVREACGGVIDGSAVSRLLGSERLTARGKQDKSPQSGKTECELSASSRSSIKFTIGSNEVASSSIGQFYLDDLAASNANQTAMGGGWPGMVQNLSDDQANAAVLLTCPRGNERTLVVSADVLLPEGGLDSDTKRRQLANAVAATARKASTDRNCGADLSKGSASPKLSPKKAPVKKISEATGTCAGAAGDSRVSSEGSPLKYVRETRSDSATPVENCLLLDKSRGSLYRVTTLHGALAQAYKKADTLLKPTADHGVDRSQSGTFAWSWSSGRCGKDGSPALIVVSRVLGVEAESSNPRLEREVLAGTARGLEERRGCSGF